MSETRNKTLELSNAIYQLYVVEGKSLNYISKLFELNRKYMTEVVKNELKFEKGNVRQATPRIKKLLAAHKNGIMEYLKNTDNKYIIDYLKTINIDNNLFRTLCDNDNELDRARLDFLSKESDRSRLKKIREQKERDFEALAQDLEGEVWKPILGYEDIYEVSNLARVRISKPCTRLISPIFNQRLGRYEVHLWKDGSRKVYKRYRLVAYAFVHNPDPDKLTTVNHIDGDKSNDLAINLEWQDQTYQNWHKNHVLKREIAVPYKKNGRFKAVVIDGTYRFKSIAAAARFLGVSETQMQRYVRKECESERKIELEY